MDGNRPASRPTTAVGRLLRWCGDLLGAGREAPFPATVAAGGAPSSFLPGEASFSLKTGLATVNPKRAWLLEALSERMLRHHSAASWRKLFLDPRRQDEIAFEEDEAIFLCAHLQDRNLATNLNVQSELALVARTHRAEVDPWPTGDLLLCFREPAAALKAAVDLQQLVGGVRMQVGLSRGPRSVAVVDAGESILRVSLGAAVDSAASASQSAPAGTIRLEAGVFELVQDVVRDLPRCVITTEYDGNGVEAVSLVMAPRASEAQSTFAGLGRI